MYVLEKYGDFGAFWSAELHKRVRCLAMDGDLYTVRLSPYFDTRYSFELYFQCHRFEVNQHHVVEVMPVLLKSGQSASREEAVEEMKDCRSMKQHWCRLTVIPEYGLSIFYDRLKPRSNHNYQNTLGRPKTLFMCFLSHCWRLSFLLFFFYIRRERRNSLRVLLELFWFLLSILLQFYIYSSMIFCDNFMAK